MQHAKNLVAIFLATSFVFSQSEISVFDAGNLDSKKPYGLTKNEENLLKNKKKLDKLSENYSDIGDKLDLALERIEGLQSIVEGNAKQISLIEKRLNKLEKSDLNSTNEIINIRSYTEESRKIEENNYQKINKVLNELSSLIDSINKNYVPKNENLKASSQITTTNTANFKSIKLIDLQREALKMLKNKQYAEAKERYEYLLSKDYRPARSNFMLGEIEYFTKNYANAIKFYQKSISLYDKADYTPKLLYHTAISFDKIGDKENGDKFFKFLKQAYPNSHEAKSSPTRW